jgi:hypothetical protein
MTATQMEFLGYKSFEYNAKADEVKLVMHVDNVGDVPVLIQLKNGKLDNAKVEMSILS